jgi:hypothetical protein
MVSLHSLAQNAFLDSANGHVIALSQPLGQLKLPRRPSSEFGRIKDWRRGAACYDRCPKAFIFATILAGTALFWL